MLKADPTLARQELDRRRQNRVRRVKGEPIVQVEPQYPLALLKKDDLESFLDG